ncbi:nucleotidyltransferase domain-containing protein [Candidatus Thorarchaeota archaeon]|nr:MAG: nucleotidyltransferase domain-containing protein [Candidatus Thorarchaeota archaeon]
MKDLNQRFKEVLDDTVREWKDYSNVKGVFVYGSYVRGTITANSDLDICFIWDGTEAPVRLMSTHKEVLVDMVFMTVSEIESVLDGSTKEVLKISEVVNRLRTAKVLRDTDNMLETWIRTAKQYVWPDSVISEVKRRALECFSQAKKYVDEGDNESAIYDAREGLFQLGRVTVMTNNIFSMLKPAEVLTEVRMLDPITYQLFLRTYKLKGMDEPKLLSILREINEWLVKAETLLEQFETETLAIKVTSLLAQAQREYHGALGLTYGGDYELAVLEMRQAACTLGRTMVILRSGTDDFGSFISSLKEYNDEFFNQIFVEHGAYDIQPAEIKRIISEAEFIARRF